MRLNKALKTSSIDLNNLNRMSHSAAISHIIGQLCLEEKVKRYEMATGHSHCGVLLRMFTELSTWIPLLLSLSILSSIHLIIVLVIAVAQSHWSPLSKLIQQGLVQKFSSTGKKALSVKRLLGKHEIPKTPHKKLGAMKFMLVTPVLETRGSLELAGWPV